MNESITTPLQSRSKNCIEVLPTKHARIMWSLLFLGSLNFVYRDATTITENPLEIGVLHRVIVLGLVSVPLIGVAIRDFRPPFIGIPGALMLFGAWRLLTMIWSPYPQWTMYRSIEYCIVVAVVAYSVHGFFSIDMAYSFLDQNWTWLTFLVTTAYIGVIFFPEQALIRWPGATLPFGLSGVMPRINPNGLGQMGAVITLVGVSRILACSSRTRSTIFIILGVVTMVLAQGRAAIGGFLLALLVLLLVYRKIIAFGILILAIMAILTLLGSSPVEGVTHFLLRGQSTELFWGLSSRRDWWDTVWIYLIGEQPIIGHGAFVGGRILAPMLAMLSASDAARITLDNAWLEIVTDSGVVGLVIFGFVVLLVAYTLFSNARKPTGEYKHLAAECLAILVLLAFRSFFVSSITLHSEFAFLAIVGCAEYIRQASLPHKL